MGAANTAIHPAGRDQPGIETLSEPVFSAKRIGHAPIPTQKAFPSYDASHKRQSRLTVIVGGRLK